MSYLGPWTDCSATPFQGDECDKVEALRESLATAERERDEARLETAVGQDLKESVLRKLDLLDIAAQATAPGNVAHNVRAIRGYVVRIREVLDTGLLTIVAVEEAKALTAAEVERVKGLEEGLRLAQEHHEAARANAGMWHDKYVALEQELELTRQVNEFARVEIVALEQSNRELREQNDTAFKILEDRDKLVRERDQTVSQLFDEKTALVVANRELREALEWTYGWVSEQRKHGRVDDALCNLQVTIETALKPTPPELPSSIVRKLGEEKELPKLKRLPRTAKDLNL